ncbi:cobalamin (vitamin B12) biosynthesis CbiM protein [Methanoregula boonei 6A8]|jgi:cobalt/nickel transport system permease protein|uniref:Cobalamin (Vitamin B12) biosynthesis CbiM protein n=1 Tax=Methanoregula boonei (strain DSM 21154 / JCM 14090 / 6A8) TaxID=456442 RepID=A7I8U3_METB6|nr:cobalt transporter CbiM [Methanoregula boonei]ABS56154.1 cobalamin (vitamin B12) biosynthesis CbiM protein [Methanoregula boonei 6A8]
MHIPDGYLGPTTFITMYLIMIPIWLYAGYWVQKNLRSRQVPYLALAAAFSFVIMMFNVPVPGGSSGHAVGSALVAIILGPWAAVVTTSVALLIQCLVFGDGGITAFGANCFNMGTVIPFVGYFLYKLIAGKSAIASTRRIIAAALGGYFGLGIAAGVAGFEMGLQPILEHTASGTPLYMPYGLNVTVPAMLIDHFGFFCWVELIVTGLAFAYIARNSPDVIFNYKEIEKNSKPEARPVATPA